MTIWLEFFKRAQQWRRKRSDLVLVLGAIIMLITIGATMYALIEGWSPLDAIYATVITITTVGYGDVTPKTAEGRVFAIFFTLFAITIGGYSISTLAAYTVENRQRRIANSFRKRNMNRIQQLNNHYILCGADLLGVRIAEEFYLQNVPYVIIDEDEERLKIAMLYSHPDYFQKKLKSLVDFYDADLSEFENMSLPQLSDLLNVPYLLAHPTDDSALVQAGIDRAQGLIAACADDRDNLSIIIGAKSLANRAKNMTIRIMTRISDPRNMRKMYLAGADYVRLPHVVSGMEMASHILHPEIGNWWYSRAGLGREKRGIFEQVNLSPAHAWAGQAIGAIHRTDKIMILCVKRGDEFISPPAHDLVLNGDDIIIILR